MTTTISSLQAELEELEKRIKALSTSQSMLSQIIAIRDYLDKVQDYLIILNDKFEAHTIDCEQYSTQIQDLQSQINEINLKLENGNTANYDEINSKIQTLTSELNVAIENLTTLTQNSDSTMESLDQDILALQTDLGYTQDHVEELTTELNSTNTHVGEMQTTINNLSSTQNTLTTTQTSLTSKVSSLDTRLTSAEKNISALTGGIDVGELDSRITTLERASGDSFTFKEYYYGFTPSDFILHSKFMDFSVRKGSAVKEMLTLNYTSTGTGTLTLQLIKNYETVQTIDVDLSTHPNEFTFKFNHIANTYAQSTKIIATCDGQITYNSLLLEIIGTDIETYKFDKDLKVACFNNKIYITRYQDGLVKYGVFTSTDEVDLDNLPNSTAFYNDRCEGFHCCQFIPYVNISNGFLQDPHEILAYDGIDGKQHMLTITKAENFTTYEPNIVSRGSNGDYVTGCYNGIRMFSIKNDSIFFYDIGTTGNGYTMQIPKNTHWKYAVGARYNNFAVGDEYFILSQTKCLAQDIDGYFYFFNWQQLPDYIYKVAKGIDATVFGVTKNDVNVYITDGQKVDKYRINSVSSGTSTPTLVATILDCDCVYETYNNQIIKHVVSTNTWEIDTLEY